MGDRIGIRPTPIVGDTKGNTPRHALMSDFSRDSCFNCKADDRTDRRKQVSRTFNVQEVSSIWNDVNTPYIRAYGSNLARPAEGKATVSDRILRFDSQGAVAGREESDEVTNSTLPLG